MNRLKPIRDENAWTPADFPTRRSWVKPLTPEMVREIEAAAERVTKSGQPFWSITAADVPLPAARPLLEAAFQDLEYGPGFAVLAGLPSRRYSRDENVVLLAVVGCHLGRVVDQTWRGLKIEDIVDKGLPMDRKTRGYMGTHAIGFHTDGSDFAVLYCLEKAEEGGESVIVSATSVYNTILEERPDLLDVLLRGFHHHRRGEQAPGEPPVTPGRIPVFEVKGGLLHCCYNRNPLAWLAPEGYGYEAIEVEALDYLDATLARRSLQLHMDFQPGDMQFINNYNVLHGRTEYRDAPGKKRHLLRLWLENGRCRRQGDNIIDLYAPWHGKPRDAAARRATATGGTA
ncbi:MAG: TauD/TfdA family dioxygenase [Alphaproteobacteria bacterium]|mgnify:CR=1 FL=1